jgi:hypothetical protein
MIYIREKNAYKSKNANCYGCQLNRDDICIATKNKINLGDSADCPIIDENDYRDKIINEYRQSIKIMDIRDCEDSKILQDRIYELHERINYLETENSFNRGKVDVYERLTSDKTLELAKT